MIKLTWILISLLKAVTAEEWHNNPDTLKSYFVSQNEMNWDSAQAECKKRHSILAVVLDSEDNDYIFGIISNNHDYWLGLRRNATDCTCSGSSSDDCEACRKSFYWANVNEPMDFIAPWRDSRPWNVDNRKCGVMEKQSNGKWGDFNCGSNRRFVCQYNCSPLRCQRRECRFNGNTYQCECYNGFSDDHCDKDIDECENTPCKNQARCVNEIPGYRCMCLPGYTGANCGTDIDECASSPCSSFATCHNEINKFTCECACGFTGTPCEINIDECSSNPCENDGTCIDMTCSYECRCTDKYEGPNCEQLIDFCHPNPCIDGATCTSHGIDYNCTCPKVCYDALNNETCECHGTSALIGGIVVVFLVAIVTNVLQAVCWLRIQKKKRNDGTQPSTVKYKGGTEEKNSDIQLYETVQGTNADYENSYQVLAK